MNKRPSKYFRSNRFIVNGENLISSKGLSNLNQFCDKKELTNNYIGTDQKIIDGNKWRFHNWVDELEKSDDVLETYANRVETILSTIDRHMDRTGIIKVLPQMTCCDLACSVGFVSIHFTNMGVKNIDCYDINLQELDRFQKCAVKLNLDKFRFFHLDLSHPFWSNVIPKYDLVFCLGIMYHMENPLLFMKNLYEITNKYCYLETDSLPSDGNKSEIELYKSGVTIDKNNVQYVLEQRPSFDAVIDLALASGFKSIKWLKPVGDDKTGYYGQKIKSVFFLRK